MSQAEALWCENCHHLVEADQLTVAGACPQCGNTLAEAQAPLSRRRVPWTFKLMMVASVIYLGYRAYQGLTWVLHHL